MATAESCTGGLIAGAITDVAGSSGWFDRGFVTYSNEAKIEMLGVQADTLAAHGAVSEATAAEMAAGALARSRADLAVAVTGVAGPDGGSAAKPVGTVCFAWARAGEPVATATRHFPGDREAVRAATVCAAPARPHRPVGLGRRKAGVERSFYAIIGALTGSTSLPEAVREPRRYPVTPSAGHAMDDNKSKALAAALQQIEKQFGKGSIMKMGESQIQNDLQVVSTGSLGLDIALGVGGLPRGRVVEIYGPESSGKTTLSLQVVARGAEGRRHRGVHRRRTRARSRSMPASSASTSATC